MPKILLVDDDAAFAAELKELLIPHGWQVEIAETAGDGMQLLENFGYDFILLDWNLPDNSGIEICKKYRSDGGITPIIFLTSRNEIESKEAGLDAGGDDYLTKPFDVRELLARIRSVQRRPQQVSHGKFILKGVEFDPNLRIVKFGGDQAQLSPTESSLLAVLCRNPNTYYTAEQLFDAVWPSDTDSSKLVVRVHMRIIRRKLDMIGAPNVVKTVRGSGYVISQEDVRLI